MTISRSSIYRCARLKVQNPPHHRQLPMCSCQLKLQNIPSPSMSALCSPHLSWSPPLFVCSMAAERVLPEHRRACGRSREAAHTGPTRGGGGSGQAEEGVDGAEGDGGFFCKWNGYVRRGSIILSSQVRKAYISMNRCSLGQLSRFPRH